MMNLRGLKWLIVAGGLLLLGGCVSAARYEPVAKPLPSLTVNFADPAWDGKTIPKNQQCIMHGGQGATPALKVAGIPQGANAIIVEFNDADFAPLSYDGGHGKVGFWLKGGEQSVTLPAVAGETRNVPEGTFIESENMATGQYAAAGYLPPCSGGRGNNYFAVVKAVFKPKDPKEPGKLLAEKRIELGRY